MRHFKFFRQPSWSEYFKSFYKFLRVCFFIFIRFPHISAIISLLASVYDLYDFLNHYFNKKNPERSPVMTAAVSRFSANFLIGLGYFVPLITIATFMVINPMIIPLVALHPAATDFFKFFYLFKKNRMHRHKCLDAYLNNPIEINLNALNLAKNNYYATKQDFVISTGLLIGTAISAAGLICPPLILLGLSLSISFTIIGLLDKKYHFSKKIYNYFHQETNYDLQIVDMTSVISMKPIFVTKPDKPEQKSVTKIKTTIKHACFFDRKKTPALNSFDNRSDLDYASLQLTPRCCKF